MLASTDKSSMITVHNPLGYPPKITGKRPAPRPASLDGKRIYLVDCRFDDSIELLKQVKGWFERQMPLVETKLVSLNSYYGNDDGRLWEQIRADGHAAIFGVGHCSNCAPAVTTHAISVETKYGVPAVAIHTDVFDKVVRSTTRVQGLPQAPVAFVPQPVMGQSAETLRSYVEGEDPVNKRPLMRQIVDALTINLAEAKSESDRSTPRFLEPDTEENLHATFIKNRWSDMLPIVLPTPERVAAMLAGTSRKPHEVVGKLQMTANRGQWEITVEKVAVNAVMAGARPEYLPVILALASTNQTARNSSSSSAASMVVVNGPIRNEIGMNYGVGAMGPYNHANATIGRAYGLLSQNGQGGSIPGESYMGSLGNGHSYNSLTFAENEERSPWEPLHVQKGYKPTDSTVSIFWGCRTMVHSLGLRERFWREHVRTMLKGVDPVARPCLLLDPIAARQFIDRGGFTTKASLARWIHETSDMPAEQYWDLQLVQNYVYPLATGGDEPHASNLKVAPQHAIRIFPEDEINVVVVGGETNGYWQIAGATYAKTVNIDAWR